MDGVSNDMCRVSVSVCKVGMDAVDPMAHHRNISPIDLVVDTSENNPRENNK